MGKRVIVGIDSQADWAALKRALVDAGAQLVNDPSPSLPDAVVAELPDNADMSAFIASAKRLPGVRYAEADAWVSTGPLLR